MSQPLSVTTHDGIRTIELQRPPRNLLDPDLMSAIVDALDEADQEDEVTGVILTGQGDTFCGGLDIEAIQAGASSVDFASHLVALLDRIPKVTKPVVAAVNGDAVASGASLAIACDYVAAVPEASIGTYEASVGIWPMIAQVPLIHRLGPRLAMENVGTGEPWTAQRAKEVGAVNEIVPVGEVVDACVRWLSKARRAGEAARVGRPVFYELAEMPYDQALSRALDLFTSMFD